MSTRQSNQENSSIFDSNRSRRQQPTPSNIPSNQQQEPLNSSPSHSDQASKACCFCWCCCCSCSWYVYEKFCSFFFRHMPLVMHVIHTQTCCAAKKLLIFSLSRLSTSVFGICTYFSLSRFRLGSPHHTKIGPLLLFISPGEFSRMCL